MTLKRPEDTFVRTPGELTELWRDLMGDGGFGRRSIWMVFLAVTGELAPAVVPIDDIPVEPDPLLIRNLAHIASGIIDDGLDSAAFLLSRPGPVQMLETDRRWARALTQAFSPALRKWPIHLATCDRVQVFALDDLIAA